MGVHKDSDVGEIVVIVDDPRKIHHDFVSLVLGRMQRRGRIISDIDGCLLLWHLLQYPIDILMLRLRNYQCRGKVVLWRHWRAWLEHGSRVPVRIVWVLDRVFGRLGLVKKVGASDWQGAKGVDRQDQFEIWRVLYCCTVSRPYLRCRTCQPTVESPRGNWGSGKAPQ